MTRKLQKAILLKKEGQRRSPRISAVDGKTRVSGSGSGSKKATANSCLYKNKMKGQLNNGHGPAFQTRGRKKRKLRPVQEVAASASLLSPPNNQDGSQSDDDENVQMKSGRDFGSSYVIQSNLPSELPSPTLMPEKRILELVIDTLQRRDSYEIFAEPVDPNEVEDYYEIIEEPMDFGTMRAKLHEGMYKSLEQFEHDVFLIFNNAMHFNSAGTIFFRQARAISELAKKVFHDLKTSPEKFELEFSETKRRVGRRNQGDLRASTNVKSSEPASVVSQKVIPISFHGTSSRKGFKENQGRSGIGKHVNARNLEVISGTRDSGRSKPFEVDRRSTYRPSASLDEDDTIFTAVCTNSKLLEHVNQQSMSYKESLMLFVKDLGPTAQNIAKRKLLGCEIHTASTSVPWNSNIFNTVTPPTSQNPLSQFSGRCNEIRSPMEIVDLETDIGESTSHVNDEHKKTIGERTLIADKNGYCQGISLGIDKLYQSQPPQSNSYNLRACAEDLNSLTDGSKEIGKKLVDKPKSSNQILISESGMKHSQNNFKFELQSWPPITKDVSGFVQDRSNMPKTSSEPTRVDCEYIGTKCPPCEVSCSSKTMEILKSDQTMPRASNFFVSLPYLKTRLDQMNSADQLSK